MSRWSSAIRRATRGSFISRQAHLAADSLSPLYPAAR
jgi:hypothetical protein